MKKTVFIFNVFIHFWRIISRINWMCNNNMTFLANHIRNSSLFLCCLMKMLSIFRDMTCIVSARMSFFWFWLLTFLCLEKLISLRNKYLCLISISDDIILVFTIYLLKYRWHFNWWIFQCSVQRKQFSSWNCWQKKSQ